LWAQKHLGWTAPECHPVVTGLGRSPPIPCFYF